MDFADSVVIFRQVYRYRKLQNGRPITIQAESKSDQPRRRDALTLLL